ncbi:hypothetical protein KY092_00220 [Natronomonas gomsonensis]|jgi:hypothetical protein|uniref:hypothetical protein n=1 Tax=Natronomonas gomsonensis TaxID=1046043 RepID=UPI0020CA2EAD|nr:hypothetical protein [Natronomonas gomsonensis]MCY4728977.1 hypothetical protein [Natronomonas gomsonensis]
MDDLSDRIAELSERARRDREAFEPPVDPPDEEAALEYLVDGVGDVVGLYIEARTGELVRFDDAEFAMLERALNDWLDLYAACYGVDLEASFTVREAAELVVDTHSIRETAILLTNVPDRDRRKPWSQSVSKTDI